MWIYRVERETGFQIRLKKPPALTLHRHREVVARQVLGIGFHYLSKILRYIIRAEVTLRAGSFSNDGPSTPTMIRTTPAALPGGQVQGAKESHLQQSSRKSTVRCSAGHTCGRMRHRAFRLASSRLTREQRLGTARIAVPVASCPGITSCKRARRNARRRVSAGLDCFCCPQEHRITTPHLAHGHLQARKAVPHVRGPPHTDGRVRVISSPKP